MDSASKKVFGQNALIYLGKRKIRTQKEYQDQDGMDSDVLTATAPKSYPETYADVSGMSVEKAFREGGSGFVVKEQKAVRVKSEGQVEIYRKSMVKKYPSLVGKHGKYPFHVINCKTVGARQELLPADKLERLKTLTPELFTALFAGKSEEEQLGLVDKVWDQLASMK